MSSSTQNQLDLQPPGQALLKELEIINSARNAAEATEEQERRGLEIVTLCNDAPRLKAEVERLTKQLDLERDYRRSIEKDIRNLRSKVWAYKGIDDVYKSLKQTAEHDAQAPIDECYREVLAVLEAIATDESACTCHTRGWHGEGHDTQCPIRIATDAHPLLKSDCVLEKVGSA